MGSEPQPQHPRSLFKVLIQINWLKLVDWRVSLRVRLCTSPLVVVVVMEQRCEFVDFVKLCICHLAQTLNIRANVWLSGWNEVRVVTVSVKCVNRTHQLIQRVKILFGDGTLLIKLSKFGILIVLNGLRGGRHFWWWLRVLPHRNHVVLTCGIWGATTGGAYCGKFCSSSESSNAERSRFDCIWKCEFDF